MEDRTAHGGGGLEGPARSYPAGEVVFRQDEPGRRMYVVHSGRVRLARHVAGVDVTLAVVGPGDFFGEMALLEKLPRTATATVVEAATLLEVGEADFEALVRRSGELSVRLLRRLSSRLREADRQIQALLAKSGAQRAIEALRAAAGAADAQGRRLLPARFGRDDLTSGAGLSPREAERTLGRLVSAGVLERTDGGLRLASEDVLGDFALYLELQERYDPLAADDLAGLSGLPEEEVHRIVKRLLDVRMRGAKAGAYEAYLELKRRFEYPDHP